MGCSRNIYKECCNEIISICKLFPGWSVAQFVVDEHIDITNSGGLLDSLKKYRAQLELDNNVIISDEEANKILEEGKNIMKVIIKQRLYGED